MYVNDFLIFCDFPVTVWPFVNKSTKKRELHALNYKHIFIRKNIKTEYLVIHFLYEIFHIEHDSASAICCVYKVAVVSWWPWASMTMQKEDLGIGLLENSNRWFKTLMF